MKITYYLEVISSWCHWAEPTWSELKKRYAGQVDFEWKIALMPPDAYPVSKPQCDWFYRRSGTIVGSPYMLNSGWFESSRKGDYSAPNLVAEAGRDFGITDDRLRLVLSHAAVRDGKKIGDLESSVQIAANTLGLNPGALKLHACSETVRKRVDASTKEFLSHQISQRPAFVLSNSIGDKAVFSGLIHLEPLVATLEAMKEDAAAYQTHKAHFGTPPEK